MRKKHASQIVQGLKEAIAIERGEADPRSFEVYVPGKGKLSLQEKKVWSAAKAGANLKS